MELKKMCRKNYLNIAWHNINIYVKKFLIKPYFLVGFLFLNEKFFYNTYFLKVFSVQVKSVFLNMKNFLEKFFGKSILIIKIR